ncbi:MAG TPA: hypothetical protein VHV76_10910 [Mycobacteriales bacterium]|nr:hypothetical protein [Mycobacteriales bacterium]
MSSAADVPTEPDTSPTAPDPARLSYAEFGAAFVHEAVTPERITAVIHGITGEAVRVGPMHAGPGGVATANAVGHIGEPSATVTGHDPLAYQVSLPAALEVDVTVAGTRHHFDVEATIRVAFTVALAPPLSICIVPDSPTYRDVDVVVHPKGVQARVLARAGNVEREMRKHIARYVRERLVNEVAAFSTIDLMPLMKGVASQLTGETTS